MPTLPTPMPLRDGEVLIRDLGNDYRWVELRSRAALATESQHIGISLNSDLTKAKKGTKTGERDGMTFEEERILVHNTQHVYSLRDAGNQPRATIVTSGVVISDVVGRNRYKGLEEEVIALVVEFLRGLPDVENCFCDGPLVGLEKADTRVWYNENRFSTRRSEVFQNLMTFPDGVSVWKDREGEYIFTRDVDVPKATTFSLYVSEDGRPMGVSTATGSLLDPQCNLDHIMAFLSETGIPTTSNFAEKLHDAMKEHLRAKDTLAKAISLYWVSKSANTAPERPSAEVINLRGPED